MKAYIVSNTESGKQSIEGLYYLITEQGEVLASHFCSHIGFAMGDLYSQRPNRIEEFADRFGTLDVDYLGNDEMTMAELIERNQKFYEELEKQLQEEKK